MGIGPIADLRDKPPEEVEIKQPSLDQPFVIGSVETPSGVVPKVSSALTRADMWGTIRVRSSIGRMDYSIEPGLYALGNPTPESHVLVSANYKLSFDALRKSVPGMDAWILVLDTKGINVWCAAGKGTFSTDETILRVKAAGLSEVVSHKQLIVPQLGAPGVAAHVVIKQCGFKVIYGPVEAVDIPAFIEAGLKATPEMRRKEFPLRERAVLIPVELVAATRYYLALALLGFLVLAGLGGPETFMQNVNDFALFTILALAAGLIAGAILLPIFLPWLPGQAFSVKGAIAGFILGAVLVILLGVNMGSLDGRLHSLGWLFLISSYSAFLAMNFTGASTYTSLSGVRKEMKYAVPAEIGGAVLGLLLIVLAHFTF